MPDIKIKRYADKENLKKLMKYSKDTFANKNEINEKFYTKEQIDRLLESGSGGTGGGGTGGDYYTKSEIDTKLTSKANTSDLAIVATSGDYNDLINSPAIRVEDDGSLYVKRDTDGNFFRFTHTGWSTSGSDAWGGMYFQTSDGRDVFGFAARQTNFSLEKFSLGNNGYLRGYDTDGNSTVTLVLNGGTAGEPDTQNITVDGTFINAGDQKPYDANTYTIGTSDMPYKAMYAGTFKGNLKGNVTGNASTATKLAAKRTIALSGAATGTATGFDGSGNITIPVTALASSAIRAQWYAAYPDGAEAHNAMWGGRDITAAFDSGEFSEHVADGSFKDIFPGDYITRYDINWVVADCDYWINKGDQDSGMKTHHVVIIPQSIPPLSNFTAHMNLTNTTEGGYASSEMYRNVIPTFATDIVNAFGADHILTFRDLITNKVDNGASSGWSWYDAQCNLMCERMVYGMPAFSSSAWDAGVATRQFSAFRLSEKLINYNRKWWWLRDVVSSTHFAEVDGCGCAYMNPAGYATGSIRPFALLK